MSIIRFRTFIILLLLAAYLIAEHGFMLVRIPPTSQFGVPLAEITILLFAITFVWDIKRIRSFALVAPLAPLFVWWGLGLAQATLGFYHQGIWAIRDASHLIDSFFIWIGFVVAATPGFLCTFSRWLRFTCNLSVIYGLLFPLREQLAGFSPQIPAPGGYVAPLLFNYASGALMLLIGAARLLLDRVRVFWLHPSIVPGLLIAFSIAAFQARTTYLHVMVLLLFLAYSNPRASLQMAAGLFIGLMLLLLLLKAGLNLNGRLGHQFSLDFLLKHFAAIWGQDGDGEVVGAASGTFQRLRWWAKIWVDVTSEPTKLLFGLGYGIPLTDFRYINDVLVREPHNSTISVFARLGTLGLIAFLWFQIALTRVLLKTFRHLKTAGDDVWCVNLSIIGLYILFVWVFTIGEDGLEKPSTAIPFYFFWGVVLRVAYAIKVVARTPDECRLNGGSSLTAYPIG